MIGNRWNDLEYNPWSVDEDDMGQIGPEPGVPIDDQLHVFVARIDYVLDGDDTLTVWLDPDCDLSEEAQTCPMRVYTTRAGFNGTISLKSHCSDLVG